MMEKKKKAPKSKKKRGIRIPKGERKVNLSKEEILQLFEKFGTYRSVEENVGIPRSTFNDMVREHGPDFIGRLREISAKNALVKSAEAKERAAIEHRTERTRYERKNGKWEAVEKIVTVAPPHIEFVEAIERQANERLLIEREPLVIVLEENAKNNS